MQKLYLDCDGVILDTINYMYKVIEQQKIPEDELEKFYKTFPWEGLIEKAGVLDNSIEKIKELTKYFDVEILTHVNSEKEIRAKFKYFTEVLPDVKLNVVPKVIKKGDIVNPKGAILVDDYMPNLEYWEQTGGIPVKFSDNDKECKYIRITDLLELLEIDFTNKVKIKE